ncbi:MAG: c-type cytochrome [Nitrospiria bacterium]
MRLIYSVLLSFFVSSVFVPATGSAQEDDVDPKAGRHLFRHYCAVCHGFTGKGNGINADNLGDVHPTDLTSEDIDKLDDEEIYEVIEGGGAAIDISYYMPPWGSVFSPEQINDIIAYIRTLSEANGKELSEVVRFADVGKKGEDGCVMCHSREKTLLRPIAPNIGHEGSKLRREWLARFLKQPELLRPVGFMPFTKSKMPNFFFTDAEVEALVSYLMTLKDEGVQPDVLAGWDPTDPAEIEQGEILYFEDYACDGCHKQTTDGQGGAVGPVLSYATERIRPEWMFYWIKNPQAMRPDTPMPNFNMPDDQIRSILAYLYSLNGNASVASTVANKSAANPARVAKGKKLVESKNCKGCHLIDSFNSQLGAMEEDAELEDASDNGGEG